METISVDRLVMSTLHNLSVAISEKLDGDCIFIKSGFIPPLDNDFRYVVEGIKQDNHEQQKPEQKNLIVILETTGGSMETVERLVSVMRKHYNHVSFIIPDYAYSAGTVLALSGDRIYMDYYSVLGPIDPQFGGDPGYGYLVKYHELRQTINDADDLSKVKAEHSYLINKFDPVPLFVVEQAIKHGITLIKKWLPKYKFKDWNIKETQKTPVTDETKEERAQEIAETLGDATKWHSHGRGIGMEDLRGEDIKLMIDDFGADEELNMMIRNYHALALEYSIFSGINDFILHKDGVQPVQIRRV
ncbi:MAG: SDH family Clp fold serine proteinase [Candidatus Halichondribacter symbioticus]